MICRCDNPSEAAKPGSFLRQSRLLALGAALLALSASGAGAEDRYCREYQTRIEIGGRSQPAYGTVCRQPGGGWKFAADRAGRGLTNLPWRLRHRSYPHAVIPMQSDVGFFAVDGDVGVLEIWEDEPYFDDDAVVFDEYFDEYSDDRDDVTILEYGQDLPPIGRGSRDTEIFIEQ